MYETKKNNYGNLLKSKETSLRKDFVLLQLMGVIKSKEPRMVTYSRHLISIIQSCQDELGIKIPIRISTDVGDHPCFLIFL